MQNNSLDLAISQGCEVELHFTILLEDGTVAETTRDEDGPLSFIFGDGTLTQGLEAAIVGMKAGEKDEIEIGPGIAFGEPDEESVLTMNRSEFDLDDVDLVPGLVIEFEAPNGDEIAGTLVEVDEKEVQVDFNHPLCRRKIFFDVEIISVQKPLPPPSINTIH